MARPAIHAHPRKSRATVRRSATTGRVVRCDRSPPRRVALLCATELLLPLAGEGWDEGRRTSSLTCPSPKPSPRCAGRGNTSRPRNTSLRSSSDRGLLCATELLLPLAGEGWDEGRRTSSLTRPSP